MSSYAIAAGGGLMAISHVFTSTAESYRKCAEDLAMKVIQHVVDDPSEQDTYMSLYGTDQMDKLLHKFIPFEIKAKQIFGEYSERTVLNLNGYLEDAISCQSSEKNWSLAAMVTGVVGTAVLAYGVCRGVWAVKEYMTG